MTQGSAKEVPLRIFLSYSRRDMQSADGMVGMLEAEGFEVTIDRRDLPYGEEWQAELADFIRNSDTVVWLVSPASVASRWCRWELGEVQRLNKRLVPVMIGKVAPEELPEALGRIHVLPVDGVFDPEVHLADLVSTLRTNRGWLKEHTRLADRARQWIARQNARDLLLRGVALSEAEIWRDRQPPQAPPPSDEVLDLILQSRRAHGRRQRITVAGSVAVAAIALVLSGVALWQRNLAVEQTRIATEQREIAETNETRARDQEKIAQDNAQRAENEAARARSAESLAETRADEAEAARAKAERALSSATRTANDVVVNLALRFRDRGLPTDLVSEVLGEARKLQDALGEEVGDRLTDKIVLSGTRAYALEQVGFTLWKAGDSAGAKAAYEECVSLVEDLEAGFREVGYTDHQRLLQIKATCVSGIGDILANSGDGESAMAHYLRAVSIAREIASARPEELSFRKTLSENLAVVAGLQGRRGDVPGAIASAGESVSIAEELVRREPDKLEWQRLLAQMLHTLGIIHSDTAADFEKAMPPLQRDVSIRRELAAKYPENTQLRHDLAVSLDAFGLVRFRTGDTDGAVAAFTESMAVLYELFRKDPLNSIWAFGLVEAGSRIGDVRRAKGDAAGALDAYEKSLEIARALVKVDPGNAKWKRVVAERLIRIGDQTYAAGDGQRTAASYGEALDIFKSLMAQDGSDLRARISVVVGLLKMTRASSGAARRAYMQEALALIEPLEAAGLLVGDQKKWPDMVRRGLASAED